MHRPGAPVEHRMIGTSIGPASDGVGSNHAKSSKAFGDDDACNSIWVASRKRVLIVDDNDRHLDILSSILGDIGYDIETCGTGAEALNLLRLRMYDVVLLDLVMPDVSGVTVAAEMRSAGLNRQTPVVICTANRTIAERQLSGLDGIHAIIDKPIDTVALLLAIERAPARVGERSSLIRI